MEWPDEHLVERCKSGDLQAFELLFQQYERRVFSIAARILGNRDDAEDVKQETFLHAFRAIRSFQGRSSFATWLLRITKNLCLDQIKRRRPTCALDESLDQKGWRMEYEGGDPSVEAERLELREHVQRALLMTPPHYRILLVLRHIEGLPYSEIAEIVGCSVNALNVRLHRAREALKDKMRSYVSCEDGQEANELQTSEKTTKPSD